MDKRVVMKAARPIPASMRQYQPPTPKQFSLDSFVNSFHKLQSTPAKPIQRAKIDEMPLSPKFAIPSQATLAEEQKIQTRKPINRKLSIGTEIDKMNTISIVTAARQEQSNSSSPTSVTHRRSQSLQSHNPPWSLQNASDMRNFQFPSPKTVREPVFPDTDIQKPIRLEQEVVEKFAVQTRAGYIPGMTKPNQDASMVIKDFASIPKLWMLGVMDGHGINGHLVSQFTKQHLPQLLQESIVAKIETKKVMPYLPSIVKTVQPETCYESGDEWLGSNEVLRDKSIKQAFTLTQDSLDKNSQIDANYSGTTCVICFVSQNMLVCANSGDSRAIMCSQIGNKWHCAQLSRDHKPDEADEAARIRRNGGRVEQSRLQEPVKGLRTTQGVFYGPLRVWLKNQQVPGLAMTRSIGDMAAASVGVTAEPELMVIANLSPADRILVIASDGIWDRINNEEVMTTIATKFYPSRDAEGACTFLVKTAAERWQSEQGMVDDITIVIAFLNVGRVQKLKNPEKGAVPSLVK